MSLFSSKASRHAYNYDIKHNHKSIKNSSTRISPFFNISQKLESIASKHWAIAYVYFRMFYKKKLEREMSMAKLNPGDSVLHIGCGPCPYSAIFLAQKGIKVKALDFNLEAVLKARNLVKNRKLEDNIHIGYEDGKNTDCTQFDAIWISLNIHPKEKIIKQNFSSIKDGGVIIYRNVPKWLSSYFITVPPDTWSPNNYIDTRVSWLGSQSVMVKKNGQPSRLSHAEKI